MMQNGKSHAGFTLVELLVVLAIVAVLMSLLFPAISKVRQRGWAAQSSNNLRQLAAANAAYAAENGYYAPADDRWNNRRWHGSRTSSSAAFEPEGGYLADYLGASGRVVACPLFTEMLGGGNSFEEGTGGYGYNAAYIGGTPQWGWHPDGSRISARPAQVERFATTMMFATTAYARADGVQEYPYAEPPYWDFGNGPVGSRPTPSVHFRFDGKAIVAWCDGHVTMEAMEERDAGQNPHGGDPSKHDLGWFGPDEENGVWNPRRSSAAL